LSGSWGSYLGVGARPGSGPVHVALFGVVGSGVIVDIEVVGGRAASVAARTGTGGRHGERAEVSAVLRLIGDASAGQMQDSRRSSSGNRGLRGGSEQR